MENLIWLIFGFAGLIFLAVPAIFVLAFVAARKRGRPALRSGSSAAGDSGSGFLYASSSSDDCGSSSWGGSDGGGCSDGGGGGGG